MALNPNLQLEVAFATPEGQRVIKIWKSYVSRSRVKSKPTIWHDSYRLWTKHFEHIAPVYVAYYYWVETRHDVS